MQTDYFKDKKIVLMGLGLLGRGVGDAKFLAEQGAELLVTDLKTEEELKDSLDQLADYPNITYRLGEHTLEDFQDADLILRAPNVPLDSPYLAEAAKNNIQVTQSAALLVSLLKDVTTVGITGTRGKSTVTQLCYELLEASGTYQHVHLAGNVRGAATLPLLAVIQSGDALVLELDSWQLQSFAASDSSEFRSGISPHISVFTNLFRDHMNYYVKDNPTNAEAIRAGMERYFRDKAQIFAHHTQDDFLVAGQQVSEMIIEQYPDYAGQLLVPDPSTLPSDWNINIPGDHNRSNIALAVTVAGLLDIPEETTKSVIENFTGVEGRLQLLREVDGVTYYNDNNATSPDATLAALKALDPKPSVGQDDKKNIVLIMGGADKELDHTELVTVLPEYCKAVVLLNASGTEKIKDAVHAHVDLVVKEGDTLQEAFAEARSFATSGDIVLFSPAFASFGLFTNEYDRNDQFVALVNSI